MKRIATIILNRNLPIPTNHLYEHLKFYDGDVGDVFILEAGSDPDNLSKYYSWYAEDPDIRIHGLRYGRGMNFALLKLLQEGLWHQYEAFFLLTNDTELSKSKTLEPLLFELEKHKRVGVLSPCSKRWGERFLLEAQPTKYFWFIHNHALLLRRTFVEEIMETDDPTYMNFIFDGANFRGFLSESELIAKAYANDWAAAITVKAFAEENESYLLDKADLIRTEEFSENIRLYIEEGMTWLKRKYGFKSRWAMNQYAKAFYEDFFKFHPELSPFKI